MNVFTLKLTFSNYNGQINKQFTSVGEMKAIESVLIPKNENLIG